MNYDGIAEFLKLAASSMASLTKVALMSKGVSSSSHYGEGKELVIMGNGPSLRKTIDEDFDFLLSHDLMAVNFAALSDEFLRLRPLYYILADGHFFNSFHSDVNVRKLWENLGHVSWNMTLLIPTKYRDLAKPLMMHLPSLKVRYFNLTPVEGFKWLRHLLFKSGMGMPRPRNVLIPAIMEGIRMGYDKIYLCGADHSWTKTLDVDHENFVVSIQPHFYEDNEEEHQRVRQTYKGLRLHDVLGSMTVAFKSYWNIAEYAKANKIEIINATPGSMIDAFPRRLEPF